MNNQIEFTKLKNGDILQPAFETLSENNIIKFSNQGIAVIYAPNGTGKTTIARILQGVDDSEIEVIYNDKSYHSMDGNPIFHVINDQLSRNIIRGNTDEFILGENIAKERQAKSELDSVYFSVINDIKNMLKEKYVIAKKSTALIESFHDVQIKNMISLLGKRGSNSSNISIDDFIDAFSAEKYSVQDSYDSDKMKFYLQDMSNPEQDSLISQIHALALDHIKKNDDIKTLERNTVAIEILKKYNNLTKCIVCDTDGINPEKIIESKTKKNKSVRASLGEVDRKMIDEIITKVSGADPFAIRKILFSAIEKGDGCDIVGLCQEFDVYCTVARKLILNDIVDIIQSHELKLKYNEYNKILNEKLELAEDDELLIRDIISESLGREIELERDAEKNIVIKLSGKNLLETPCQDLHLSSGEQNFISLAFELLKAKKIDSPVIVMDDPISSFDSIYKNKIAYCIVKILEYKKQIIFTHNVDLIRLLDVQRSHCFELYILSNDCSEPCGFINVGSGERNLVLYLDKLLDFIRSEKANDEIIDLKMYIISLIPFMRGLIKIINPPERMKYTEQLTSLMHGYNENTVDVSPIYNNIFCKQVKQKYELSAQDIVSMDVSHLEFMKADTYPLLERTLRHTLLYLYLRLNVERELRIKFPEKTKGCELLGDFIHKALRDKKYQSERVRLTAKKTLLNEFNHYEGNLNLFQPAIDITETNLEKERLEIIEILQEIKSK
jgi:ABC-type lipoprotein export system ATPase subunit